MASVVSSLNSFPERMPRVAGMLGALISESQFDFWAREFGSITAWRRVFARVQSLRMEGAETLSIELRPNRNFQSAEPGQHVNVSVEIDGRLCSRSYSLSRPAEGGCVSISVRREPGGLVSNYIHDHLRVGDVLELSQPYGELVEGLAGAPTQLFLAAGSGITAIYNLIAEQARRGEALRGELWYWEKQVERFCFTEELDALCQAHPQFSVRRFCNAGDSSSLYSSGRLSPEVAAPLCERYPNASVFACGGSAFVEAARELFSDVAGGFYAEAFSPPQRLGEAVAEERFFEVSLTRSGQTITVSSQQSLLDALEDAGHQPPHGCRMGICNSCSCGQRSGESQNQLNGEQLCGAGSVRLCVSRANSNIELDI